MFRKRHQIRWAFIAFLFFLAPCCFHGSENAQKILIMGQVRHPHGVLLSTPIDFEQVIRKVGGLSHLADTSRVHIYFDQEHSAVRHLVVDIEKLMRLGSQISLEHVTTITIPEIRVGFPGHESYETAKRGLKLSEAEARARIVECMKGDSDLKVPSLPKIIVGSFYWFTNSERSVPSPEGWYVNGLTGDIKDFYWDRNLFGQP